MRDEKDCSPEEKFLFSDELFSDESIEIWKNESKKRLKEEHKGELFDKFINWKRKENEVALFTLYAYADFKIPKNYDCIFNFNNPSEFIISPFELTQCLYEGFFPTDSIEDGHKHTCIFKFENEVPQILKKLHIAKGKFSDVPKNSFIIGICDSNDFSEIKKHRELQFELKEKYGTEWYKYYKTE